MKIINKKVADLIPYHNNPRINDGAIDYVASSIKEFGFKVPIIIDSDNIIVSGHTRLKAAKKLKIEEVPCILADDLTPAQVKAFRIADNKVHEFSVWDFPLLDIELQELKELDFDYEFGFEDIDIKLPSDKQEEPEVYNGFIVMMKIPHEIYAKCKDELNTLIEKYGIETDIS